MASDQTKINSINGLNMAKVYVKDHLKVRILEGFNKTFLPMVSISECNNLLTIDCGLYARVFMV